MTKQKLVRPTPISGFPEWLPAERQVELSFMDRIRAVFEAYGFCSIETPSVETLDVLAAKGAVDKEIYVIQRLHADPDDKEARLGLHFDVTVPFARYVAQHFNELTFPFKRYQMQRVWRGERPQEGRFREFYQCDVDVINVDGLPMHFDAELPQVVDETLRAVGTGPVRLHLSNRKILEGYLKGLGVTESVAAIRLLDQFDKIGADGVEKALVDQLGFEAALAQRCVALAAIRSADASFAEQVRALDVRDELLDLGLEELAFVMEQLALRIEDGDSGNEVIADLSIARGFDYYTGTVYEGRFIDFPDFGSIVAGGRYDDLAGSYINKRLPGVGISIGLTRLFSKLMAEGRLPAGKASPTHILVILPGEEARREATQTANRLRARGFNVELYHAPQKYNRQLSYASKKGIPFVWFPPGGPGEAHEVKDMTAGVQGAADPENWTPPAA